MTSFLRCVCCHENEPLVLKKVALLSALQLIEFDLLHRHMEINLFSDVDKYVMLSLCNNVSVCNGCYTTLLMGLSSWYHVCLITVCLPQPPAT